ncbi:MAG: SDR family oxidoreductase [Candidatus Omnitrophica bacterium]|nr:SDR family oxidoreductase [Candidatus Omnitrophota bacterium]
MKNQWAVILGASSGFGEATALELAKHGVHICGVHLDRKTTLANVERIAGAITSAGARAEFFNVNAADADKRKAVLDRLQQLTQETRSSVKVLMHSLAFGALKRYIAEPPEDALTQPQMEMTLDVMAHSLVYWTQELVSRKLMTQGGKVFAMTSSGGARVWHTYGAVSAAKAALESHMRQLALELAPYGITANTIRAGVTDTPALRKIPGNEEMMKFSTMRNPYHRLTTPPDVAQAIATLCNSGTHWVTGNVIGVDGGEDIVG